MYSLHTKKKPYYFLEIQSNKVFFIQSLKKWEEKIKQRIFKQEKRNFIKSLLSFYPIVFHKNGRNMSRYPQTQRVGKVCDYKLFENINIDIYEIYDFSANFFINYNKLLNKITFPNLIHSGVENSDFSDVTFWSKNTYLSSAVVLDCENIFYSFHVKENSRNVFNSIMVWENCNNIYFSTGVIASQNIFYSTYILNSYNIWFSSNLQGCRECIFCKNLEKKKYHINNKEYVKETYYKKKKEILSRKKDFLSFYKNNKCRGSNFGSRNVSGSFIIKSEDFEQGNMIYNVSGGRNGILNGSSKGGKKMFNCFLGGSPSAQEIYLSIGGDGEKIFCSDLSSLGYKNYYCFFTENCSFCLGCVGLKNKSYCILNKEYSKEEWYKLADKIFSQMEKGGILGEFFPGNLNPFYFNDTVAYLIDDSFTKEELEKEGFMWRDEKIKVDIPEGVDIVYSCHSVPTSGSESLKTKNFNLKKDPEINSGGQKIDDYQGFDADGNWQINPEILKKVIVDKEGNYYKIVKTEYDFLVKHELPLPEIHWLDRIKLSFKF